MRTERIELIEQYIRAHEVASLEELTREFGVSMNTIRRDVSELAARGTIRKVYGGVTAVQQGTPLPMSVRADCNSAEKRIIGELAATLVEDNASIFVDSGSTTLQVLPHLADRKGITVVTHSLSAMCEASRFPNLKLIGLGGVFNPTTASFVDLSTAEALSRISVQTVLIAATGVSLEHGLTNTTLLEADAKRRITERGLKVVLLADHSKFDTSSVLSFFAFEDLYAVVTDRLPPERYLKVMEERGIRLLCPETVGE